MLCCVFQLELLSERVTELEKDKEMRDEEIRQLTLQLELRSRENRTTEEKLHTHITQLQVILTQYTQLTTQRSLCSYWGRLNKLHRLVLEVSLLIFSFLQDWS